MDAVPARVGGLLLGGGGAALGELHRVADEHIPRERLLAAVAGLLPAGADLVGQEVGRVAAGLLDLDLTDVIAAAWYRHHQLARACRETAESPGTEVVVTMASHTLTSDYAPHVDVVVDGVTLTSIEIRVSLRTDIEAATAVVRGGRVVALRAGRCELTGTLSCEGVPVAERRTHIDLPGVLGLPGPGAPGPGAPGTGAPAVPQPRAPSSPRSAAGPGPARPPVGWIRDGWRFTARGEWERVTHYRPGDMANGYRLGADGSWQPLPPPGRRP